MGAYMTRSAAPFRQAESVKCYEKQLPVFPKDDALQQLTPKGGERGHLRELWVRPGGSLQILNVAALRRGAFAREPAVDEKYQEGNSTGLQMTGAYPMSNPPVPLVLRRLRGNPGKRRMHPEPQPTVAVVCPEPPTSLTPYACDEWWRVAPQLHALGLLSVVDVAPLAAYCDAYSRWRTASEATAKMADGDLETHGLLVKTTDGDQRRNPLVQVAADSADSMIRFASQFGLTPVARARLAAGVSLAT